MEQEQEKEQDSLLEIVKQFITYFEDIDKGETEW